MTVLFLMTYLFGQEVWFFKIANITTSQYLESILWGKLSLKFFIFNK